MKTLNLKVRLEDINGVETVVTSHGLIKTAINQVPQNGFTVEEMMVRLELLRKIDEHKSLFDFTGKKKEDIDFETSVNVDFENSEFEKLKSIFMDCKWAALSSLIVEISNDMKK